MNPFSSLMYIIRDYKRVLVTILVLSFVTVCFLAGMYINNPEDVFKIKNGKTSTFLFTGPSSGNAEILDEFYDLCQNADMYKTDNVDTIMVAGTIGYNYSSIMAFDNGDNSLTFNSKEDFDLFNSRTHAVRADVNFGEGEVIISKTLADNIGMHEGDVFESDNNRVYGVDGFVIKEVIDEPGMWVFSIGNINWNPALVYIKSENASDEEAAVDIDDMVGKIKTDYPNMYVSSYSADLKEFRSQLGFMTYILFIVVAIVGVVMAVTINSLFSVIYDRRKFEFSIYKALGFKTGKIFGKIAGEVLTINAAALLLGSIVCATVILSVNYIMKPRGLGFVVFSIKGLIATILCDLIVIIPVILINWRRVRKYDVTEN